MTFKDLINKVSYKRVFNVIHKEYYLDSKYSDSEYRQKMMEIDYSFSKAFDSIRMQKPSNPDEKYAISFRIVDEDTEEPYIDVFLYDEISDENFAVDFCDWCNVLSYEVSNPLNFTNEEMVAHILWEITFWGFSQEKVNEQKELTLKSIEQAESGDFEEMNLEDLLDELR